MKDLSVFGSGRYISLDRSDRSVGYQKLSPVRLIPRLSFRRVAFDTYGAPVTNDNTLIEDRITILFEVGSFRVVSRETTSVTKRSVGNRDREGIRVRLRRQLTEMDDAARQPTLDITSSDYPTRPRLLAALLFGAEVNVRAYPRAAYAGTKRT